MIKKLKKLSDLDSIYTNGLLFVGDPHLTMVTPARRLDENFLMTLKGKLMQIAKIANENGYSVIILGDLFDKAKEKNDNDMLAVLFEFLRALEKPAFCLAGNHDLTETQLTPDTTLHVVSLTGLLNVVAEPGIFARFVIGGETVTLGGTPSGTEIPDSLPLSEKGIEESAHNIWITHEDLAFPGAYPNALPFKEIEHVELVVNGHMHMEQPPHTEGGTTWFNPGNIVRRTIADRNHKPAVWSWRPETGLHRHRLTYIHDVFDLTGYHVDEAGEEEVLASLNLDDMSQSMFVELLENDLIAGKKTEDGGMIVEIMDKIKLETPISAGADKIISNLLNRVVHE